MVMGVVILAVRIVIVRALLHATIHLQLELILMLVVILVMTAEQVEIALLQLVIRGVKVEVHI